MRDVRERRHRSGELVEVMQKTPAKSEAKEPIERTGDPVRIYLREMRSIGLLSRQGEVAIAKRIEANREATIDTSDIVVSRGLVLSGGTRIER